MNASPDVLLGSKANPRSLEYVSNFLHSFERLDASERNFSVLASAWSGLIGERMATALLRYYQGTTKPPSAKQILRDYSAIRPTVRRLVENGDLSDVESSLSKLKRYLQRQQNWNVVVRSADASSGLLGFLDDIPPDMSDGFGTWCADRGYDIRDTRHGH